MRLPIYCGIVGALAFVAFRAHVEFKIVQEEKVQAFELKRQLDRTLNERQWLSWKPPFGRWGLYKSISQSGDRIWGVRWEETEVGNGMITNIPEDEIEWGFGNGPDGTKDFIRVDSDGRVILSEESIEAIAIYVLKVMKSNENWKGGSDPIINGPIVPYSTTPNPFDAARVCIVCGKQKTRDFHGGLEYKAYGGNTGSLCTTIGCDFPYIPYCDDHRPEKEAKP